MKRKTKIVVSFLVALFFLTLAVNLPIVPYTNAYCQTSYESFMTYAFPCGLFGGCLYSGAVRTVTIVSWNFSADNTANQSMPSSSSFSFSLNNPSCTPTYIVSLSVSSSGRNSEPSIVITNWDNNRNPTSSGNLVNFTSLEQHGGSNFLAPANVTSFVYYPTVLSSPSQSIVSGNQYNIVLTFRNGQSVSGTVIAVSG